MKATLYPFFVLLLCFSLSPCAGAQETKPMRPETIPELDPGNSDSAPSLPESRERPKSYRERYVDFYTSDNYAEQYREAFEPKNYRRDYLVTGGSSRSRRFYSNHYFSSPYWHDTDGWDNSITRASRNNSLANSTLSQPFESSRKPLNVPPVTSSPLHIPDTSFNNREFVLWHNPLFLHDSFRRMFHENQSEKAGETEVISASTPEIAHDGSTQNPLLSPSELIYSQGVNAFATRNYTEALRLFESLEKISPDNPNYHMALGLTYFSLGNYSKANHLLRKATEKKTSQLPSLHAFYPSEADYRNHYGKLQRFLSKAPNSVYASELASILDTISANS